MTRDKYFTALSKEDRPVGVANVMARYIKSLEATIKAQEIIIKDKSAIMEAMAQPKVCEGCTHITHRYGADCFGCMRLGTADRYEPKEKR